MISDTCAQPFTCLSLSGMSRTTTESANIYKYCKVDFTFAKKVRFYLHISKKK